MSHCGFRLPSPTKNDFRLTGDKIPFLPGQKKDFPFRKRRTERTPFPENRRLSLIPIVSRRKIQSVHFQRSVTKDHMDKLACRENLDRGSRCQQRRHREVRYARYLVSGFTTEDFYTKTGNSLNLPPITIMQ